MKSILKFYNEKDKSLSNCGDPLDIEKSSDKLGWQGIILEKGWSPHFYPTQIVTPYFYFALALEHELKWKVENKDGIQELKTIPGDIWINPPWTAFTHKIDFPCFFIILAIEKDKLIHAYPEKLPVDQLQFLNNYNLHDNSLKNYIELFYHEVDKNGVNGIEYIENLLKIFSVYFINNYSNYQSISENNTPSKISKEQVKEIHDYILANIEEPLTIDELALEINMSKFYFLKEFKKATSLTPYQYLMNIRMKKAAELIRDKNLNLADLAFNLGFNDQSHFSRVFKNYHGETPKAYRKKFD